MKGKAQGITEPRITQMEQAICVIRVVRMEVTETN
jgi:hypothetical protein